jgi:hypothetical protein
MVAVCDLDQQLVPSNAVLLPFLVYLHVYDGCRLAVYFEVGCQTAHSLGAAPGPWQLFGLWKGTRPSMLTCKHLTYCTVTVGGLTATRSHACCEYDLDKYELSVW